MSAAASVRMPNTIRSPGISGPLETILAAGEAPTEAAGADAAAAGGADGAVDSRRLVVAALLPRGARVIATIAIAARSDRELVRDIGPASFHGGGSPTGPVCVPLGHMTPADG